LIEFSPGKEQSHVQYVIPQMCTNYQCI